MPTKIVTNKYIFNDDEIKKLLLKLMGINANSKAEMFCSIFVKSSTEDGFSLTLTVEEEIKEQRS